MEDKELFALIADGKGHAFSQIFDKYFEQLHWRAFNLLKSKFWADEMVQEVFIQLWQGRIRLKEIDNPEAYLRRMTYNRCFDRMRQQESENKIQYLINQVFEDTDPVSQSSNYDYDRLKKLINEAINLLPAQGKTIYLLQQQENLNYEEIARRLDISKNTVRNHMVKNLQHIRSFLLQKGDILLLIFYLFNFFKTD